LKKELKRHIKEDEVVTGVERAWRWLVTHGQQVRTIGASVGAAALLVLGVVYFQASRERSASAAFDAAMKIYETPLASEIPPGQASPGITPFASAAEKYKKAAGAFDGVERSYPSLSTGARARYFAALCRIELGDFSEARKALETIAAKKEAGAVEPGLARLALADIDRRIGAMDKAIESYRELSEDATAPVPRDYALMSLATTLEDAKRLEEARASYKRLSEQFPDSVYASEARRRAAYLATDPRG
jgi:tetratricopeptide (TPR) repeat protein